MIHVQLPHEMEHVTQLMNVLKRVEQMVVLVPMDMVFAVHVSLQNNDVNNFNVEPGR